MKKVFAVLAVLAVAAAAQAELLATWTGATVAAPDNSATVDLNDDGVMWTDYKNTSISDLYAINGATSGTSGTFGKLLVNDEGQGAFGFGVITYGGNQITGATLAGSTTGSPTGPGHVFITGGSESADFTRNRTGTFEESLGTLSDGAVVKFTADLAANGGTARSSTETFTNSGGTLGIKTMSLSGTVSSVPEPATMSLLGLGALAMALRRKLRK